MIRNGALHNGSTHWGSGGGVSLGMIIDPGCTSHLGTSCLRAPGGPDPNAYGGVQTISPVRPTSNHQYYGSVLLRTHSGTATSGHRAIQWFAADGNNNSRLTFLENFPPIAGSSLTRFASIQTAGPNVVTSPGWVFRIFVVGPRSNNFEFTGIIMIDLTSAFGVGNEPNTAWMNANVDWFEGTQTRTVWNNLTP